MVTDDTNSANRDERNLDHSLEGDGEIADLRARRELRLRTAPLVCDLGSVVHSQM